MHVTGKVQLGLEDWTRLRRSWITVHPLSCVSADYNFDQNTQVPLELRLYQRQAAILLKTLGTWSKHLLYILSPVTVSVINVSEKLLCINFSKYTPILSQTGSYLHYHDILLQSYYNPLLP